MKTFSKKLLSLLLFSLIFVSAENHSEEDACTEAYNTCIEACANDDESCMNTCDEKYECPETDIEGEEDLPKES